MSTDTYLRDYPESPDPVIDAAIEILNCTGVTDVVKVSNRNHVLIANKTFVGSPGEQDIDQVRGFDVRIEDCNHEASTAHFNIELKGGILSYEINRCHAGSKRRLKIRLGDYTIYDGQDCPWWMTSSQQRMANGSIIRAPGMPKPLAWLYHGQVPDIGKRSVVIPWCFYLGTEAMVCRIPPPFLWAYFFGRRTFFPKSWQS
jgi:hypothetical protein